LNELGQAKSVEVGKENTIIIDGAGQAAYDRKRASSKSASQIEEATSELRP